MISDTRECIRRRAACPSPGRAGSLQRFPDPLARFGKGRGREWGKGQMIEEWGGKRQRGARGREKGRRGEESEGKGRANESNWCGEIESSG